ncbi:hypothetical protein D9V86_12405, partial [Bacteroidetes/Chlorobi group bacterium ChocPot_Mid]
MLIFFLLLAGNVFAGNNASYIIKIKENKEKDIFGERILSQLKFRQFIPPDLILAKEKNDKILSDSQKNAFNELTKYYIIEIPVNNDDILNDLRKNKFIESVEPNYVYRIEETESLPNDPQFKNQWTLKNIFAIDAWEKATGKGILIGIIDTGIDYYHPDLVNQLWINTKEDLNKNGKFDPW